MDCLQCCCLWKIYLALYLNTHSAFNGFAMALSLMVLIVVVIDACVVELQLKDGTLVVSNSMPDNVEEVKQQTTNTLDPGKSLIPFFFQISIIAAAIT